MKDCRWEIASTNLFLNNAALGGAGVTRSQVTPMSRSLTFEDRFPLLIKNLWFTLKPGSTNTVEALSQKATLQYQFNVSEPPVVLNNYLKATTGGGGGTSYLFDAILLSQNGGYENRLEFSDPIRNVNQFVIQQFNCQWEGAIALTDQLNVLIFFEWRYDK